MDAQLKPLLADRASLVQRCQAIITSAKRMKVDITEQEERTIDAHLRDVAGIDQKIRAMAGSEDEAVLLHVRGSAANESTRRSPTVATAHALLKKIGPPGDPKRGFSDFGEFAHAVQLASTNQATDERLFIGAAAPGTFGNENIGVDGGFAVPAEFAQQIVKLSLDADAFLPMTDQIPVTGNSVTVPSDETLPWNANGVRAFWTDEAALATATKPIIKPNTMRLRKLVAYVPMTDELLADAAAAAAFLASRFARAVKWKVNDAIINGTGAGMPLGIAQCPALVVIAKDAGQAANTLSGTNLANMLAAMPADYLAEAVWVIAPDAWTKAMSATLQNVGVWAAPPPGAANAPGGYILGKPVFPSQTCAALSAQGDIYLINFRAYMTISKQIQVASSMHLYFDADATAFRCSFRVDGQPAFKAAIVQRAGAQAQSPYITLAAR
jgi:HK97 family phage major capsid protein